MGIRLRGIIELVDKTAGGTASAGRNLEGLTAQATDLAAGLDIAFGVKVLGDMAKVGAQAERVEYRFNALSKGIGGADEVMAAFQAGAGGTADKMTAMTSASKLLQMGITETTDEMESVVEMATRLGDQTQSVADRTADFAMMLANTSIPRLDNFGISSGNVRKQMKYLQEELGKTREEAFKLAVAEEGAKALAILGDRADDNLLKFEKLEAKMADTRVEIGQALLPVFTSLAEIALVLVNAITPLVGLFDKLPDSVSAVGLSMGTTYLATQKFAGALGPLTEKIGLSSGQLGLMSAAVLGLVVAWNELQGVMEDIGKQYDKADEAADNFGETIQAIVDDTGDFDQALETAIGNLNEVHAATESNIVTGTLLGDVFGASAKKTEVMGAAARDLHRVIIQEVDTYQEYLKAMDHYNASMDANEAKLRALTELEWENLHVTQEAADATERRITQGARRQQQMSGRVTGLQREKEAEEAAAAATEARVVRSEASAMRMANAQRTRGAAADEAQAREEELARAEAITAESAARAAERADALALAQRNAAEAAAELANKQATLAEKMTGATEEMFKQAVFEAIDPAAIGIEAWGALGVELGVLDEKSVALSEAALLAAEAVNIGAVSAEEAAPMMTALWEEAEKVNPQFQGIIEKSAEMPQKLDWVIQRQELMANRFVTMGEATDTTTAKMQLFGGQTEIVGGKVGTVANEIDMMRKNALEFEGVYTAEFYIKTYGSVPGGPGDPRPDPEGGTHQFGGVVPGSPGGGAVPAWVHPGEIILNPQYLQNQPAIVPRRVKEAARSLGGGDLITNNFYDQQAYSWWNDQQRRKRRGRFDRRIKGR